jgi:hypothetical protein
VKADQTVLVEVVVGHEVRRAMVDRFVQIVESHLGGKVELEALWLRKSRPVGQGQHRGVVR